MPHWFTADPTTKIRPVYGCMLVIVANKATPTSATLWFGTASTRTLLVTYCPNHDHAYCRLRFSLLAESWADAKGGDLKHRLSSAAMRYRTPALSLQTPAVDAVPQLTRRARPARTHLRQLDAVLSPCEPLVPTLATRKL